MSNVMDLLLAVDPEKVKKPQKEVEITRLSKETGGNVVFTIEALTADEIGEIQETTVDIKTQNVDMAKMKTLVILKGLKNPDLKNKDLIAHYGVTTPAELLNKMLLPGEVEHLYNEISGLCGFRQDAVTEVKN